MGMSKIVQLAQSKADELPERQASKIKEHLAETLREAEERGYLFDSSFGCCSQATLLACQEMLDLEDELALKAASFFSGGVVGSGVFCGALTGGIMALGMVYGRSDLSVGAVNDSSGPALKLYNWFIRKYGTVSCRELIGGVNLLDPEERAAFLTPGNEIHEKCFRRCGEVAAKVLEIICEQGSKKVSLFEALEEEKKLPKSQL